MLDQQQAPHRPPRRATDTTRPLTLRAAATMDADAVLDALGSTPKGLSSQEAAGRLKEFGPIALVSHGARPLEILANQFRNPLLIPLISTAVVSAFVGEKDGRGHHPDDHRDERRTGVRERLPFRGVR